ncbi:MAG: ammonia-forming cytochrome c nitrite reductase [Bacteroidales bacterium]|jgi:nitrite reductase (cytochrome c-552)|nr:ammonia-forming cytochrome c nitrite reductase [Bacteroidales bacterium]
MSLSDKVRQKPWIGWAIFIATAVVVFFLGLLANSVMERRTEAQFAFSTAVKYDNSEPRNAVWGKNFPREYQSYLQTSDTSFRSKYNGGAMIDMLEVDPRLVVLWAGYGFAKDYNQGRGHYYAIEDIRKTLRTGGPAEGKPSPQPNTCWACKSTDVPRMMKVNGPAEFYNGTWDTKGHEIVNAIGCADCHDAKTMNLQISRPALKEAFERKGIDLAKVSHQEMRSLVCAQCHVEYFFDKREPKHNYLTFPWDNGYTAEDIERYYDSFMFTDWTHALSKAPMLKAQHPDWEVYMTGIHAERGVSCADCHMPYKSEGGQKFTDHHLQSPLNNVEASCAVCHREKTTTLIKNVYDRQDKIIENRDKLEELLVRAHVEAKKAWDLGASEEQMKPILMDIRHAQWRWDYAAASHGASFHAPVEIGRVVSTGINIAQDGRIKLARLLASLGHNEEIPYPDITTKEKAQAFIGLDMAQLEAEKQAFLKEVVPEWDRKAAEREATYPTQ